MDRNKRFAFTRRHRIRLISYAIALTVGLTAFGITAAATTAKYRSQLSYTYERGLAELAEHLNNIDTALTKGQYTGTAAGAAKLARYVWGETGAAKTCLTQIPSYGTDLTNTYKFLSQVGEYSLALAGGLQKGKVPTKREWEQLRRLASYGRTLAGQINDLCLEMSTGGRWEKQLEELVENRPQDQAQNLLYTSLQDMEQGLADFPTLLYDGPFSDHLLQKEPLYTKGKSRVLAEQATDAIKKLTGKGIDPGMPEKSEDATIPCYEWNGKDFSAAVTIKGGIPFVYQRQREIGEAVISEDDCIALAAAFLRERGLGEFKQRYYAVFDGICLVNFAYTEDGVVYYPDLVKVGVAMDNGQILSYNAEGYIMNHTARSLPQKQLTAAQAKKSVSSLLQIKDVEEAVIPSDNREPLLCYEFACSSKEGDDLLVYINAVTGEEEELLILTHSDGGTLTR